MPRYGVDSSQIQLTSPVSPKSWKQQSPISPTVSSGGDSHHGGSLSSIERSSQRSLVTAGQNPFFISRPGVHRSHGHGGGMPQKRHHGEVPQKRLQGDIARVQAPREKKESRMSYSFDHQGSASEIADQSPSSTLPMDNQSPTSTLPDHHSNNGMFTMTGTMRRGKKAGEIVQVELKLNQNELDKLNKHAADDSGQCGCGLTRGLHIALFTFIFIPFAFVSGLCMNFYIGTMCWYNLYLYLSEDKTIWHRIFLSPWLIIFYPLLIVLSCLLLSLYGSIHQVSWCFYRWERAVNDFDKGFYGWLCKVCGVAHCSPYEVVILEEGDGPRLRLDQQQQQIAQSSV